MVSADQTDSTDHFLDLSLVVLLCLFLLVLYFYPGYQLNIPYTKFHDFGTQTSYFPTFEILTLFPFKYPINPETIILGGLLIDVFGLGIFLLRLFLHLSIDIIALISLVFLIFFTRRILFFYILVQKLYDTCNSILYVLKTIRVYILFFHRLNPPMCF